MSGLLTEQELQAKVLDLIQEAKAIRKLEANMVNLTFDPEEDAAKKIVDLIQSQKQAARLEEVKELERRTAREFDQLCERVRNEPSFGNSSKGKKDNFLDGAESMILIASIRMRELENPKTKEDEEIEELVSQYKKNPTRFKELL